MSCEARVIKDHHTPMFLAGEAISLTAFHERGMSLLTSIFLRRLLIFYILKLHHVTLGGVLYVAAFQILCESFLGILPHFAL
jgi:hypothetical protein